MVNRVARLHRAVGGIDRFLDAAMHFGLRLRRSMPGKGKTVSEAEVGVEPVDTEDARNLLEEFEQELYQRWSGPLLHDPSAEVPAAGTGLVPPDGLFLLARVDGAPAGCVGVRVLSPGVGEIKRMFVRPAFRGLGIGRSLLAAVEAAARDLGRTRLRLDTMEELTEARHLYHSSGYREIDPYTTNPYIRHWMEKDLRTGTECDTEPSPRAPSAAGPTP